MESTYELEPFADSKLPCLNELGLEPDDDEAAPVIGTVLGAGLGDGAM
jgi:hypothetical protein